MSNRTMGDVVPVEVEEVLPSSGGSLAVQLSRAEIDQQVATARAFPRSIERAVANIMTLATLDEATSAECIYALVRDGKTLRGPSVRFAEIVVSQWGNCRSGSRVVHVDREAKTLDAEGVFHDLETNTARTVRVRRSIATRTGRLYPPDMIVVAGNAACSIAHREAVLKSVPRAVWRAAYERCERVIAGRTETLAATKDKIFTAFAERGVEAGQLFAALGVGGAADITLDHVVTLRGMYSAIQSGEASVESLFGAGPKAAPPAAAAPLPAEPAVAAAAPETAPKAPEAAPAASQAAPARRQRPSV